MYTTLSLFLKLLRYLPLPLAENQTLTNPRDDASSCGLVALLFLALTMAAHPGIIVAPTCCPRDPDKNGGTNGRLRLGRSAGTEGSGGLRGRGAARLRRCCHILLVGLRQEDVSLFRPGPKKESVGKVIEGVLFSSVP